VHTSSEALPREKKSIQKGNGLIEVKSLATLEQMYGHARLFGHIRVDPGCSIGSHCHEHETEFYYILKGEAAFDDNGSEVVMRPGDLSATGYGQRHGLENRSLEPVELIALIVME
jgi:mannose-6-phosphate isomerase-like protein (cupin superfamily)